MPNRYGGWDAWLATGGGDARNNPSCPETEIETLNLCGHPGLCLLAWEQGCTDAFYRTLELLKDYGARKKQKYPLRLFSKLGWGSYCRLCIHYCFPLVPLHQYSPEKIWCGGTFHWQSMSGWVDSVLIWDNGASHVWLTPLGHIGVSSTPSGCVNGLEIHWGSGCVLCVCVSVCVSELGLFSTPEVPITDYQTKEKEQGRETRSIANNATVLCGWGDMQHRMCLSTVCGWGDTTRDLMQKIWAHAKSMSGLNIFIVIWNDKN